MSKFLRCGAVVTVALLLGSAAQAAVPGEFFGAFDCSPDKNSDVVAVVLLQAGEQGLLEVTEGAPRVRTPAQPHMQTDGALWLLRVGQHGALQLRLTGPLPTMDNDHRPFIELTSADGTVYGCGYTQGLGAQEARRLVGVVWAP